MRLFIITAILSLVAHASALEVDQSQSEFKWTGTKVTGKHFGKLKLQKAQLKEKKGQVVGGEFVIDMNSITVEDLKGEWKTKFLGHIKSGDFFEVEKYKTAKLVIKELKGKVAKGKLTIKDKTHPVEIRFEKKGDTYTGKLVFDRTKYGMIYGSGNFFKNLGDKMIHNDVTLEFKVKVKKS